MADDKSVKLSDLMNPQGKRKEKPKRVSSYKEARAAYGKK